MVSLPQQFTHVGQLPGKVVHEPSAAQSRIPGGLGEAAGDRRCGAGSERGEGIEEPGGIREQPGRDGNRGVQRRALVPKPILRQRTTGAPVAVDEGMDGLELGMRHRDLKQDGQVVAGSEGDYVVHTLLDPVRLRGDEVSTPRTGVVPADPDESMAPHAGVVLDARLSAEKFGMHGQDGWLIDVLG